LKFVSNVSTHRDYKNANADTYYTSLDEVSQSQTAKIIIPVGKIAKKEVYRSIFCWQYGMQFECRINKNALLQTVFRLFFGDFAHWDSRIYAILAFKRIP